MVGWCGQPVMVDTWKHQDGWQSHVGDSSLEVSRLLFSLSPAIASWSFLYWDFGALCRAPSVNNESYMQWWCVLLNHQGSDERSVWGMNWFPIKWGAARSYQEFPAYEEPPAAPPGHGFGFPQKGFHDAQHAHRRGAADHRQWVAMGWVAMGWVAMGKDLWRKGWLGKWLVDGSEHFEYVSIQLGIRIPSDCHIFQRGG